MLNRQHNNNNNNNNKKKSNSLHDLLSYKSIIL